MTYATQEILRDLDGKPIPQLWDEVGGVFRPLPGDANGLLVNTELSAAVAASDALGNPTAPQVLAMLMAWDGTEEQRARFADTTNQNLQVQIRNASTSLALENNSADGIATSATAKRASVTSVPTLFNGTTFDRQRGNLEATAFASAARTGTATSADIINYNGRGVVVMLDVTANPGGAEALSIAIQGKDPVSGNYVSAAVFSAAITAANGSKFLTCFPGAGSSGTVSWSMTSGLVPRTFRIQISHSASGSWTYSVGYALIA